MYSKRHFAILILIDFPKNYCYFSGDWQYLPLLSILGQEQDLASEIHVDAVKSCLTWVRIMNVCVGIKSAVFCYSRLATVYMAASDLFLNVEIRSLIKQCLVDILQSGNKMGQGPM